jgi:hypothetical protein
LLDLVKRDTAAVDELLVADIHSPEGEGHESAENPEGDTEGWQVTLDGLRVPHNYCAHHNKEEVKRGQPLPRVVGEPVPRISQPELDLFLRHR